MHESSDEFGVSHEVVTSEPASASALHEPYVRSRAITVRAQVEAIIRGIAADAGTGVTVADVMGKSRFREVVAVRHQAMVEVAAAFPWMSYPQMGRAFGNRDHSTVMHALTKLGVRKPRQSRGWNNTCARLYGGHIDFLFVRIGAALSVPPTTTEGGSTHENS